MMHIFEPQPGLKLHLESAGQGSRAVVFQHGLCGAAAQPAEVFPDDRRWRRLTLECRAHGQSGAGDPADFSIASFAADVIAMMEQYRVAPLVIGGISMGAGIAARIAVLRPDLVRGLVLARPAWVAESAPANMQPNAEVGALLAKLPAEEARQVFMASTTAQRLAREAPDNLASLESFFSRAPQHVTAALLSRISADGPGITRQQLQAVSVPTLVIGHGRDAIHPLPLARELAGLIPAARLVEITAKADDKARYVRDFRQAMLSFLEDLH